jgi:asparagine synthase (glutamine-hydrolysing)
MCGIAVAIGWDEAERSVRKLVDGLRHRGDVSDPIVCPLPGIAAGTRRLRIVDAERAVQPQASFDNRIIVSFNGEIYNHAELRRELEAKGVLFRTDSDTEVLASSLRMWGPQALQRVNGMYAFVAIDLANGEFLAARDPLGVKPLYLIQSERGFLFCSEIRPLLDTCEEGMVLLVPPGHLLTRTQLIKFGGFVADGAKSPAAEGPAALDKLLAEAVRIRVPPDLPIAMMFSGGIDSTLVAHYARRVRPNIASYFLGDDRSPDYAYAALFADMAGLDLRRVALVDADESLATTIDAVVTAAETFEPSAVRDGLCNFLLARRIHADGFRVALCGEGADELFAGYEPLELAFQDSETAGRILQQQTLAIMHKTNLQRLDRLGMRFGVEVREPFLDRSVIRHALGLPAQELVKSHAGFPMGKAPLRAIWDLYPDTLPSEIRYRQKTPMHMGSGLDKSQRQSPLIEYAEATISDRELADGKLRFAAFDVRTKEEFLYLDRLSRTLDLDRVPHLTARPRIKMPQVERLHAVRNALSDYLVDA